MERTEQLPSHLLTWKAVHSTAFLCSSFFSLKRDDIRDLAIGPVTWVPVG